MFGIEFIAALLALALPAVAIAAFFMAIGLRRRLGDVETRLRGIEHRLADARQDELSAPPLFSGLPTASSAEAGPAPAVAAPGQEPQPDTEPQPDDSAESAEGDAASSRTPPSPGPPTTDAAPAPSLEERFGTRWIVWAGGLALALGGIFLVQFSIERGLLGPPARIFLGAILAVTLAAVAEWLRRSERQASLAGLPAAHIPSILTAAATTIAYATVYAAYGLYDFLNPAIAFVLLGVVALTTMAAALLHGPALAGLGLVGAFVAPLLVAAQQPNYWALTIYLGVVSAAAFTMARVRHWRWLASTAVVFGVLWMLPGITDTSTVARLAHAAHAVIGFMLAAAFIVSGLFLGPDAKPGRVEKFSSGVLAAYLIAAAMLVLAQRHDTIAFVAFAMLIAMTVWIAFRAEAATAAVPAAAVLVALVMLDWSLSGAVVSGIVADGPSYFAVVDPRLVDNQAHIFVGAGFAALFGLCGYFAQGRSESAIAPILWAASAASAPLAILLALYVRLAGFERSIPFTFAGLALAALFVAATQRMTRHTPRPGLAAATAIFACGTVAGLALAVTLALEKGWLSVALALMVPGIAWVGERRKLPALRWAAAALILVVVGRSVWEPQIVGSALGTTPIFNWLLWGYGVPAFSFWLAGILLRRHADDLPARITDAAAILFTVLLAFLEIRHFSTGGDIYAERTGLTEVGLQVSTALAMAIGLERVRERTGNIVHDIGALIIAGLAFAGIAFGLAFSENPLIWPIDVGGRFFNLILLGYAFPALLVTLLALTTRQTRPHWYGAIGAGTAVALVLVYLTLQVRRFFHGPVLAYGSVSDPEQYAYSVAWLLFGVALLVAGVAFRSQGVRIASAVVVMATVGKVFLVDMGDLEGVFRAMSFIGLGLTLVAIGWIYQRILFPRRPLPANE